jgi:osmotically-inducible protein OsmY
MILIRNTSKLRLISLSVIMMATGCAAAPPLSFEQRQSDEIAAALIYSALNADPVYYYRHVEVRVDRGVAHLSGFVWSTSALYHAKTIALKVVGVKRVVDEMELEREGISSA